MEANNLSLLHYRKACSDQAAIPVVSGEEPMDRVETELYDYIAKHQEMQPADRVALNAAGRGTLEG